MTWNVVVVATVRRSHRACDRVGFYDVKNVSGRFSPNFGGRKTATEPATFQPRHISCNNLRSLHYRQCTSSCSNLSKAAAGANNLKLSMTVTMT